MATCGLGERVKNKNTRINKLPEGLKKMHIKEYIRRVYLPYWRFKIATNVLIPAELLEYFLYRILLDVAYNKNGKLPPSMRKMVEKILQRLPTYEANLEAWIWNKYGYEYGKPELAEKWINLYQEFKRYMSSEDWFFYREYIRKLRRTDARVRAGLRVLDMFVHGLFSVDFNYDYAFEISRFESAYYEFEERFFGWAKSLWSKLGLWVVGLSAYQVLEKYLEVGRVKDFLAKVRYDDVERQHVIESIKDFWEDYDTYDGFWHWWYKLFDESFTSVFYKAVSVLASDIGSAIVADRIRTLTIFSMRAFATFLWDIASVVPALRGLKFGSTAIRIIADFLDKSILAWFGWQIAVEWRIDGLLQSIFNPLLKFSGLVGNEFFGLSEKEFNHLLELVRLRFNGIQLTEQEKWLWNYYLNKGGEDLSRFLVKFTNSLKTIQSLYNLRNRWLSKLTDLIDIDKWKVNEKLLENFLNFANVFAITQIPGLPGAPDITVDAGCKTMQITHADDPNYKDFYTREDCGGVASMIWWYCGDPIDPEIPGGASFGISEIREHRTVFDATQYGKLDKDMLDFIELLKLGYVPEALRKLTKSEYFVLSLVRLKHLRSNVKKNCVSIVANKERKNIIFLPTAITEGQIRISIYSHYDYGFSYTTYIPAECTFNLPCGDCLSWEENTIFLSTSLFVNRHIQISFSVSQSGLELDVSHIVETYGRKERVKSWEWKYYDTVFNYIYDTETIELPKKRKIYTAKQIVKFDFNITENVYEREKSKRSKLICLPPEVIETF